MEEKNTIGDRLRIARINAGLLIPDVSERTNISTGNLSKLENNINKPSADALISLSKIYDVSIDWILTGQTSAKTPLTESPPPFIPDEELRPYFEKINNLLNIDDDEEQRTMKGWIVIQLRKAFPEVAEEIKKENEEATAADAG